MITLVILYDFSQQLAVKSKANNAIEGVGKYDLHSVSPDLHSHSSVSSTTPSPHTAVRHVPEAHSPLPSAARQNAPSARFVSPSPSSSSSGSRQISEAILGKYDPHFPLHGLSLATPQNWFRFTVPVTDKEKSNLHFWSKDAHTPRLQ